MQPPTTTSNVPTDLEGQNLSQEGTSKNNPLPLENMPVHAGNPWPEAGKMSGNLFESRKDWLIPPNNNNNTTTATIPKTPIKVEPQAQEQPTTSSMIAPNVEKCGWRLNCSISKNLEEDWDNDHQK